VLSELQATSMISQDGSVIHWSVTAFSLVLFHRMVLQPIQYILISHQPLVWCGFTGWSQDGHRMATGW